MPVQQHAELPVVGERDRFVIPGFFPRRAQGVGPGEAIAVQHVVVVQHALRDRHDGVVVLPPQARHARVRDGRHHELDMRGIGVIALHRHVWIDLRPHLRGAVPCLRRGLYVDLDRCCGLQALADGVGCAHLRRQHRLHVLHQGAEVRISRVARTDLEGVHLRLQSADLPFQLLQLAGIRHRIGREKMQLLANLVDRFDDTAEVVSVDRTAVDEDVRIVRRRDFQAAAGKSVRLSGVLRLRPEQHWRTKEDAGAQVNPGFQSMHIAPPPRPDGSGHWRSVPVPLFEPDHRLPDGENCAPGQAPGT